MLPCSYPGVLRIAKTYPQEIVVLGLLDHCDEAKERGRSGEQKEATRRAKIEGARSGGVGWVVKG
jgi:hypothetical protein